MPIRIHSFLAWTTGPILSIVVVLGFLGECDTRWGRMFSVFLVSALAVLLVYLFDKLIPARCHNPDCRELASYCSDRGQLSVRYMCKKCGDRKDF